MCTGLLFQRLHGIDNFAVVCSRHEKNRMITCVVKIRDVNYVKLVFDQAIFSVLSQLWRFSEHQKCGIILIRIKTFSLIPFHINSNW